MTGSPYDWLPDRHLGVATTLAHSDELIGQVSALLFQFQTQQGDVIGLRSEKHGPVVRTVVDRISPMPPKIPRLVADALVALRAAIEHATFAEVEYLDGPLGEKAAKLVEMPAAETYDAFQEWKKKRRKNGPPSLQDGSELVRRISALQPFHRLQNPQQHPLALLVSHTNHAKRRTPASTAVLIAAMYEDAKVPRTIDALLPGPKGPVSVGDVIGEAPLGVVVPITMFPTVGINRPGTDEWPVMLNELREIGMGPLAGGAAPRHRRVPTSDAAPRALRHFGRARRRAAGHRSWVGDLGSGTTRAAFGERGWTSRSRRADQFDRRRPRPPGAVRMVWRTAR